MSSLANAFRNVFRGVASLLETGSWQVEGVAKEARSAKVLLDRVDEEVEIRAQETLDHVNEAITEYGKLQNKQEMLMAQTNDWSSKAKDAATKAKTFAVGTLERKKWEGLTRDALTQKAKFASQLKVVDEALMAAKPDADRALELVEEIGLTREQALSQRDSLQVANATAQGKLKLAQARQTWGKGSGPGQLLEEARQKVSEASARARATEMVDSAMPPSADRVAATISREQARSSVDKELAELMAG
ncbi:MAG: hypothetical protein A2817_03490 [Candidatus Yanofskybacteria bacterium RIFCSPHIGHO2_01_FULL_39_8b]|uniref:PspA/IM30 family protein n=1 Tax=Candidatus Yanofskybacteria bacterium RIFCSPHIGHO2_01_FULL_39_8b TaxID=1802659 RepID=A0A1F8EH74_9BACT|nr:MAG: hypothetical protein A2817_03490 [Candidatus Yanofskybacteria bacterium RIFCSPHIGHO2_01_FULL_39_8b]